MKRIIALIGVFCLMLAFLTFFGCSGGTSAVWSGYLTNAVQRQNSDMCSLSCDEFVGGVTYTIHLSEEAHQLHIGGKVHLRSGSLTVTVTDEAGNIKNYTPVTEDTDISVWLSEYGVYHIEIEADAFMGNYEFSWAY